MKQSKFLEEQIVYAIRQADAGTPVGDLCRQLGVGAGHLSVQLHAGLSVGTVQSARLVSTESSQGSIRLAAPDSGVVVN